jgi:hypothetical protein
VALTGEREAARGGLGRAPMRKLLLVALASLALAGAAPAQDGGVLPSRFRTFRIPFTVDPKLTKIRQVQLYVSTDQGQTWQPSATAPPDQRYFLFAAERDGLFFFAVQYLDLDNRVSPPTMQGAQPNLKVLIDTAPPTVQVQALPPRGNEVGVSWVIRDENLDYGSDALRLEYRQAGALAWLPLVPPAGANQLYWNPQTPAAIEVRLQAKDRAGNVGLGAAAVSLAGNANAPGQGAVPNPNAFAPDTLQNMVNPPADHERKLVGSKRITLNYEVKEVGPSGVAGVELWYTTNGRSWNKYPYKLDDPKQSFVSFDVEGEGLYGITLVAKSGVGLSERTPQLGDRPQVWIEVDLTRPVVQLQNVLVGSGVDKGKLTIAWSARDKNLGREPITLSYAKDPQGPWETLAEKQPNTGRYVWTMPQGVPYQFHVKVEAADQAGNLGDAITDSLVKVDLALPKVRILTVEPGR